MDATPVRSYDDLVEVVRNRIIELAITHETADAISGLQSGYTSKLVAKMKGFGPISLSCLLPALGVKLVAVEDPEALARVRSRLVKRIFPRRDEHWRHKRPESPDRPAA